MRNLRFISHTNHLAPIKNEKEKRDENEQTHGRGGKKVAGGGARTHDSRLIRPMLYRLSYSSAMHLHIRDGDT